MSGRNKRKGIHHSGGFAGIPRWVIETDDFKGLSYSAKVLLLLLANQFRGENNGDLTAAHGYMKAWGFGSKSTLDKAIKELLTANWIVRTREGRFSNPGGCCALYGLTWEPINECEGKLDVGETRTPLRKVSREKNSPVRKLYR